MRNDDDKVGAYIRSVDPLREEPTPPAESFDPVAEQIMRSRTNTWTTRRSRERSRRWVAPAFAVAATASVIALVALVALWRPSLAPPNEIASSPLPSPSDSAMALPLDALIGPWEVADSESDLDGTALMITSGEMFAVLECGTFSAIWAAGSTTIILSGWTGLDENCEPDDKSVLRLTQTKGVHNYRLTTDGWELLTSSGAVIATYAPLALEGTDLMEDWPPSMFHSYPDSYTYAPLAGTLTPVTPADLEGTWKREGSEDPGIVVDADGWRNLGCHGGSSPFRVEPGGFVVTLSLPMTADACRPFDTFLWTGYAGLDGGVLVMGGQRLERVDDR